MYSVTHCHIVFFKIDEHWTHVSLWTLQVCHTLHRVWSQTCPVIGKSEPALQHLLCHPALAGGWFRYPWKSGVRIITWLNYWNSPCLAKVIDLETIFSTRIFCTKHVNVNRSVSTLNGCGKHDQFGPVTFSTVFRMPSSVPFLAFTRKQHGGSNSLSCHPIFAQ